jgi:hypothetical protein
VIFGQGDGGLDFLVFVSSFFDLLFVILRGGDFSFFLRFISNLQYGVGIFLSFDLIIIFR